MRPSVFVALAIFALPATSSVASAQDAFSEGSEAQSWGLPSESLARFEGRVVDILCELTGDCADNCGDGNRQLGLLRGADNVLVLVAKNGQPLFTGGTQELLPFCGREIEVDGLMIGNLMPGTMPFFQMQMMREAGEAEWMAANRWTQVWDAENPEAAGEGPWYRRDPRVGALIARDGYLGLGLDIDQAYIDERF